MAYIGDSQGAAEIDPNAFIKLFGPSKVNQQTRHLLSFPRLGRSSVTDHMWWRSLYGDTD